MSKMVKSAAEILADMQPPPKKRPAPLPGTEEALGHLQYALLDLIRSRPFWAVDRAFWKAAKPRLCLQTCQMRLILTSLARYGHITLSESGDIVTATTPRRRRT